MENKSSQMGTEEPASFWVRVFCFALDNLLIIIPILPVESMLYTYSNAFASVLLFLVHLFALHVVRVVFSVFFKATPGMLLLGYSIKHTSSVLRIETVWKRELLFLSARLSSLVAFAYYLYGYSGSFVSLSLKEIYRNIYLDSPFSFLVMYMYPLVVTVSFGFIPLSKWKMTLFDRIAGTVVVKRKKPKCSAV